MPEVHVPEDFGHLDPDDVAAYIEMKLDQIARKIVLDLFTFLIEWTPVDTGRARAGWSIGKGRASGRQPPQPGEESYDEPKPPRSVFKPSKLAIWFITNNVEYIEVLEEGRGYRDGQIRGSEQAPAGFTRLALLELERSLT